MPQLDWYHPVDFADLQNLRRVSLLARVVFAELFGGELGTKTGLVDVRVSLLSSEISGVTPAQVEDAIAELANADCVVWDANCRMAYHRGHLLRHGATNDKHKAGWRSQLLAMPEGFARDAAVSELDGIPYRYPIRKKASGNQQEQEQEQEQEHFAIAQSREVAPAATASVKNKSPASRTAAQTPPTPDATREIFAALGCPDSRLARIADQCHDYWLSKGWKRGNTPIRDWPATCRTWWRTECERNPMLSRQRVIAPLDDDTDHAPIF